MIKSIKQIKKVLDYIKLIIVSAALMIIVGGLFYKYKGDMYPIDVNIVMSFMLACYVLLTGLDIYLVKENKNIGYFLVLCSLMIVILNIVAMAYR